MRVSAIVPARLPAPYLGEALDSLRAQTRPLDEILLVAHGWSPEATDAMFNGVRVVEMPATASLTDVRNAGLNHAIGDWVLLLDADDVAMPNRLESQVEALGERSDAVLISSAVELIGTGGESLGSSFVRDAGPIGAEDFLQRNPIAQSTVMMRREVALAAGGYRQLALVEDYDLWLRMRARGACVHLAEPATRYRIHEAQTTTGRRVPRSAWHALWISRRDLARSASISEVSAWLRHVLWCFVQALPRSVGPRRYAARWPKTTRVMLTGGLGNQLFQAAAALDLAHGGQVETLPDLGAPRRADGVTADALRLHWPQTVAVGDVATVPLLTGLARKSAGYMLRIGVIGAGIERARWFRAAATFAASLALTPVLRVRCAVSAAVGVGYDATCVSSRHRPLLIGYFQTWRHVMAPHVLPVMRDAFDGVAEQWFCEMAQHAEREQPIVVHVRLGDYRKEPGLGLIAGEYYAQAISAATAELPDSRIWLFSDEPDAALQMLPEHIAAANPRIVDPPSADSHPAELMRVMSLGRRFVLGNSTFGWWAAMLSPNTPVVCVPTPWFAIGDQPRDLIPPQWQQRSRETGEVIG